MSGFKSQPSQAGIYSAYRRTTPGVRLATGDQCTHFNSASDNVLLLITHLQRQGRIEQQKQMNRRGKCEIAKVCVCVCGEFTAPSATKSLAETEKCELQCMAAPAEKDGGN